MLYAGRQVRKPKYHAEMMRTVDKRVSDKMGFKVTSTPKIRATVRKIKEYWGMYATH